MLRIGDFSKLSRISIRMLHHYDEISLLSPEYVDDMTNYRYYGEGQLAEANRISVLKEMGFQLAVIKDIMQSKDSEKKLAALIEEKKLEVMGQLREAEHRIQLLDTAMEKLRKGEMIMNYDVVLKNMPERYVASVRKVIPEYSQEGMLWGILNQETAGMNLQIASPMFAAAVYYDGEYKESDVDVEIQQEVKGKYKDTEHVVFKTVPSMQVASVTFKGSYSQMNDVNMAIANWVKENGHEFAGAAFNIYYVSPGDTDKEEEFVTEVCYPVK